MNIRVNNFQITAKKGNIFIQRISSTSKHRNEDRKMCYLDGNTRPQSATTRTRKDKWETHWWCLRKMSSIVKWDVPIEFPHRALSSAMIIILVGEMWQIYRELNNTNHRIFNLHLFRVSETYHLSFTRPPLWFKMPLTNTANKCSEFDLHSFEIDNNEIVRISSGLMNGCCLGDVAKRLSRFLFSVSLRIQFTINWGISIGPWDPNCSTRWKKILIYVVRAHRMCSSQIAISTQFAYLLDFRVKCRKLIVRASGWIQFQLSSVIFQGLLGPYNRFHTL